MTDLELRRMELEAQEQREQREAKERRSIRNGELFKWFVLLVWTPLGPLLGSYYQSTKQNATAAAVKQVADQVDVGVAAAVSTNAINTKWVADKTGDPADVAKAEAAEKRLEAVAPPP